MRAARFASRIARRKKDPRVQDALQPALHAAGTTGRYRDSLGQAREMAAVELNSATDNPLVFVRDANNGDIISAEIFTGSRWRWRRSGGHRDCDARGIVERRVEQMTNPLTSMLPAFLTPEPG